MDKNKKKKQEAMKKRVESQTKGEAFMKSFLPNVSNAMEAADKTIGMGADYLQYKFANDPRRKAAEARSFQERKQKANQAFEKFGLGDGKFDPGQYAAASTKGGAELTSLVAPVGKTIKGAMGMGAASGGLYGFSQSDAPVFSTETAKKTAGGAMGGAIFSGALKAGGELLTKGTQKVAKTIYNNIFREPTKKLVKRGVREGEKLGEKVMEAKVGKGLTNQQIYDNALDNLNKFEDDLQKKLAKSTDTISLQNIEDAVAPIIKEYADSGNQTAVRNITERLNNLKTQHGDNVPVQLANKMKRTLYKEIRDSAFGEVSTPAKEGLKRIAHTIKKYIADKVEGADAINRQLQLHGKVADAMEEALVRKSSAGGLLDIAGAAVGSPLGPGGMVGVPLARHALTSTAGQKITANAMQGVSSLATKAGEYIGGPTQKMGALGGSKLISSSLSDDSQGYNYENQEQNIHNDQTIPDASSESQVNMDELVTLVGSDGSEIQVKRGELSKYGMNPDGTPLGQEEDATQYITGHSPEEHYAAYTQAVIAGDEESAKQIRQFYTDELAYQKMIEEKSGTKEKPLSGPNAVLFEKAGSALKSLDRIEDTLKKDPNAIAKKTLNPFDQTGRGIGADIASAIDVLGYFRTGAAITKEQRADYIYMFPSLLDDEKTKKEKIRRLREEFEGYQSGIEASKGGSTLEDALQSSPLFQSGQSTF